MESVNKSESKVISLKDRSSKTSESAPSNAQPQAVAPAEFDWSSIMKRNSDNGSRMQNDREKANKGVIRSYRLKH